MSSRQANSSAVPIPHPRAPASTPVGPKKLEHVASWQAKPSRLFPWIATKQETGLRANATSASLAHASLNVLRTQSSTLCFSGGKARRTETPAADTRLKASCEADKSYSFTSISIRLNSLQRMEH